MMSSSQTCPRTHRRQQPIESSDLLGETRRRHPQQQESAYVAKVAVEDFDKHVDGLERDQFVLVLGDARDEVEARVAAHVKRAIEEGVKRMRTQEKGGDRKGEKERRRADAPLVDNLLVLELDKVALLLRPREYERRDLSNHARLLLERRREVPLGEARFALAAHKQDGFDLQMAAPGGSESQEHVRQQ